MGAEQSQTEFKERNHVSFMINGKEYIVHPEKENIGVESKLVDYIRDRAFLKGTKYFCREGGCGACVVAVKSRDVHTGEQTIRSINSCLVPVFACDGWEITTVEHLGSKRDGFDPIQERMVKFHGTQCGFCSPGWIMNFYSLSQERKEGLTLADIEEAVDGNLCRCTGYRPILDAIKSLAKDAPEQLKRKGSQPCTGCPIRKDPLQIRDKSGFEKIDDLSLLRLGEPSGNERWVKAINMGTLFMAVEKFQNWGMRWRFVAGNTGIGVYKKEESFQGFIELNSVEPLKKIQMSEKSVILGGGVTIAMAIGILSGAASKEGFEYCHMVVKHWKRVANVSVRNAATLGGNLMLKHAHKEFPSDIFLVLETIGAMVTVATSPSLQKMYTLLEFLDLNMNGSLVYSVHLPALKGVQFRSFKIARRYQNAHAIVNAGFLMELGANMMSVKKSPRLVFGGISPDCVHAAMTEKYLEGKMLNQMTIEGAMDMLAKDLNPFPSPPSCGPDYRKSLAQALLYKFFLSILSESIKDERIKSGASDLERGPSHGKQTYETDKADYPLYEPVTKLEAPIQVSGEAEYVNDISPDSRELHAAVVLSTYGNATLKSVDASEALKMDGVVAWVDYKSIPGENNYMKGIDRDRPDVIFIQDKIRYAGEPIGAIMAESRDLAYKARDMVRVEYSDIQKPILTLEAFAQGRQEQTEDMAISEGQKAIGNVVESQMIKGKFRVAGQSFFCIEPLVCICIPKETEYDVYCNNHWLDNLQIQISTCLGVPMNKVNIYARRPGGSFGAKNARGSQIAAICAVAAHATNRSVRINFDMETMMSSIGGRLPMDFLYDVGFDPNGKVTSYNVNILSDPGCSSNENTAFLCPLGVAQNVYTVDPTLWTVKQSPVNTNLPPNSFCRAPGYPKSIACTEIIMDRIAFELKKDPWEIRMINLHNPQKDSDSSEIVSNEEESHIPRMLQELTASADIEERKKFVESFNQKNRWKKRGLVLMPSRYPIHYFFSNFMVHLVVYGLDGTVTVVHSGIDMGQGTNTKVAQVVARELMIPMEKIKVKVPDSFMAANAAMTSSGVTTEHLCYAAVKACKLLLERLAPVKAEMESPTWEGLIAKCKQLGMDLSVSASTTFEDNLKTYVVWGLAATEVEIDCLTGEHKIIRVDLILDAGKSLSPDLDIGQVEGAFVMALGWLLMEKLQYDENTGELLTNRTWEYKPPGAKDIPMDLRVTLLSKVSNPFGVLRSKSMSEGPFALAFSTILALRQAIFSARMDAGSEDWFECETPLTSEDIQRLCLTSASQFTV